MSRLTARMSDLIWASRGHTWGFRFLLNGGLTDPLTKYEKAFSELPEDMSAFAQLGCAVAVRFPDPLGRRDSAGRVIPHEFVISGQSAYQIDTADDAVAFVWPLVEKTYAQLWDKPKPPTVEEIRSNWES